MIIYSSNISDIPAGVRLSHIRNRGDYAEYRDILDEMVSRETQMGSQFTDVLR